MCHLLLHHLRKVKYFIARETLTEHYDQFPECSSPLTSVKVLVHCVTCWKFWRSRLESLGRVGAKCQEYLQTDI